MMKRKSTLRYIVSIFLILYPLYLYFSVYGKKQDPIIIQQQEPVHIQEPLLIQETYSGNCLSENVERNVDNNHRDNNRAYWDQLSENSMRLYKSGWKEFIQKEKQKKLPVWTEEYGIIFVAGNDDTLKRTMGTIRLLQSTFNCKLPIEIWHMEHEAETAALFLQEVSEFNNVQLRDLSDIGLVTSISRMRNRSKQFQVKAAAIINSSFRHVLYLDSDNIPTRDPTFLFHTKEYTTFGAIFWPDFWKTAGENKIFKILNIQCQDRWEQESGQIVVDKKRHWLPLQLSWFMQFYHEVYFKLLNGDKDTFQYAWQALNAPFYRIKTFVGMGGIMINNQFCGHSMLQYMDGFNQPLFIHANLMKQIPKKVFTTTKERPWHLVQRYKDTVSNHVLTEFYMVNDTRTNTMLGCMRFKEQDSDVSVEPFDQLLQGFQDTYFKLGGMGGYL